MNTSSQQSPQQQTDLLSNALVRAVNAKTHQIQRNVLELARVLTTRRVVTTTDATNASGRPMVTLPATLWQAVDHLIVQLDGNVRQLRQSGDQKVAANQELMKRLDDSLRRENQCRRQLEAVRKVCRDLRDQLHFKDIICDDLMAFEDDIQQLDGSGDQIMINRESVTSGQQPMDTDMQSVLSLIWSSTSSETYVQQLVDESAEELRQLMATLLRLMNRSVIDKEMVEIICGICCNVFGHQLIRDNKFVVQDIDDWITCLASLDNHYALMSLFNISFNRRGRQLMAERSGFVRHLADNIAKSGQSFDDNRKCIALKLIHNLFLLAIDINSRLKVYDELTQALPVRRIQDMVCGEPNPLVREDCAKLLATIGHLAIKRQPIR